MQMAMELLVIVTFNRLHRTISCMRTRIAQHVTKHNQKVRSGEKFYARIHELVTRRVFVVCSCLVAMDGNLFIYSQTDRTGQASFGKKTLSFSTASIRGTSQRTKVTLVFPLNRATEPLNKHRTMVVHYAIRFSYWTSPTFTVAPDSVQYAFVIYLMVARNTDIKENEIFSSILSSLYEGNTEFTV